MAEGVQCTYFDIAYQWMNTYGWMDEWNAWIGYTSMRLMLESRDQILYSLLEISFHIAFVLVSSFSGARTHSENDIYYTFGIV